MPMKATDLKYPFTWEERHPVLCDRVLFIPKHYSLHEEWKFPRWESAELFGRDAPVFIEYCSGNGSWIIDRAEKNPEALWVAVEKRFDRVRKIWVKMKKRGIENLLIVCGDAQTFSSKYLESNSVEGIYVNFPDPWPKDKHAKHRLFQLPFTKEIARIVKKGGSATLVTDDPPYSLQMIESMHGSALWKSSLEDPYFKREWDAYGTSFFEELWRGKGKEIHYHHFVNVKEG